MTTEPMATEPQWTGDREAKPAPGRLRRVQALINTLDLETGQDRLADAAHARPWLVANGLLGPEDPLSREDLELVVDFREALRDMVDRSPQGHGRARDPAVCERIGASVGARVEVTGDGEVRLAPLGEAVPARLLQMLLDIRDAQHDGSWRHLKACANEECRWVFYDRSRNHAGAWCEMATCGNQAKNREFRARRRVT
ncbi:CGNR zinc finger domain-containing protein [Mycolicibacterium palauense]|uniref:CGNR zinc finger domain-containing protein n=1 Tax=Mycolicibacterium palauense TaxID=2034511 RepID=UPI001FEBFD57|nr:CGNR zinc finger domain-containing protein [Mycolicibacterium palauense]